MKECCSNAVEGRALKTGTDHKKELARVNRIKGQVEGIGRMIEKRAYCPHIITQIQAVRSALASLQAAVLKGHLEGCVKDGIRKGAYKEAEELINELSGIFKHHD
jgi:CsoR family transcriptional regulator, copper-sensing transcriptional repressor